MKTRRKKNIKRKTRKLSNTLNMQKMPIVVICWNQLTYIKNMVNQLKHYDHPIILLDNHSTYEPLFEYYKEIKKELGSKIEIRMLKKNYGCTVYIQLKHTLPKVYILTDPDLELNKNMPKNFAEILYGISEKYKVYKVGPYLEKIKKEDLLECSSYDFEWDKLVHPIKNNEYELYYDWIQNGATTFCLVNTKYDNMHKSNKRSAIRIAGNFTMKHLPWYKDSLNKIPKNELYAYVKNSSSSTLVSRCIKPRLKTLNNIYKIRY
jgi:hypothetical protein